jgi:hypothetical protein
MTRTLEIVQKKRNCIKVTIAADRTTIKFPDTEIWWAGLVEPRILSIEEEVRALGCTMRGNVYISVRDSVPRELGITLYSNPSKHTKSRQRLRKEYQWPIHRLDL